MHHSVAQRTTIDSRRAKIIRVPKNQSVFSNLHIFPFNEEFQIELAFFQFDNSVMI